MRIKIEFTNEEKHAMMNMALNMRGVREVKDDDEHVIGNFGEFKYDHKKNEMTYDLKPAFIKATAGLIVTCINMVQAFVSSCEMFSASWLENTKIIKEEKTEEASDEKEEVSYVPSDFESEVNEELNK